MSKMFNKNGNRMSAKEICIVFNENEIIEITAKDYADLELKSQAYDNLMSSSEEMEEVLDDLEWLEEVFKDYSPYVGGRKKLECKHYFIAIKNHILKQQKELDELKKKVNVYLDLCSENRNRTELNESTIKEINLKKELKQLCNRGDKE